MSFYFIIICTHFFHSNKIFKKKPRQTFFKAQRHAIGPEIRFWPTKSSPLNLPSLESRLYSPATSVLPLVNLRLSASLPTSTQNH